MLIKKYWHIILAVVILFTVVGYKYSQTAGINQITTSELAVLMDSQNTDEIFFVDVREEHEFTAGHIAGMTNIPLSVLDKSYHQIPKDRQVVIICRSGNRSLQAANILKDQGYPDLVNVRGGMLDWDGDVSR